MVELEKPRVLSGVQPSGALHLGNYFGAIRQQVAMQKSSECFYFIADYHALTTVQDAETLRGYSHDVAVTYLAVGLDPEKTTFYRQSDVPEVCELTWLLQTVTSMGLLEKAHSYKEKVSRGITPSVGLFGYPILMAADILGPRANLVPVGQDQDQHVQMTRDMAQSFHHAFGHDEVFTLPETIFSEAPRVPGTTFEKGPVLQVNTTLEVPADFDPDSYARAIRDLIDRLFLGQTPDSLGTTEEVEVLLAEMHHEASGDGVTVVDRALRTALQYPGDRVVRTDREGRVGLEFYVTIPHTVFATKAGKRQAAKMSKSYGNTIPMFLEGKKLKKAVMGIETRLVELEDSLDWSEDLVFQLHSLLADDDEQAELKERYEEGGFGFGSAKKRLLQKLDDHFAPFRERRKELEARPDEVEDILRAGAAKARAQVRLTLDRARAACGLGTK